MTEYQIEKTLMVSTCHIPDSERAIADADCDRDDDFGWDFLVGQNGDPEVYGADAKPTRAAPNLLALKWLARELKCDRLRLDADGPKLATFPQYEWPFASEKDE